MKYETEFSKQALKMLRKLPRNQSARVLRKIEELAADGGVTLASNIIKLQGREGYRLRVGDLRVLYTIDQGQLIITIIDIGPRGGIYE